MAYADHFVLTDDLIAHLDTVFDALRDPYIESKYTGFLSVSAAAVLESALKEVFCNFATAKHAVFGHFAEKYFFRINGKIRLNDIQDDYLKKCGPKYMKRFKRRLEILESDELKANGRSTKTAYENLITWRHEFAHAGRVPAHASYPEVKYAYSCGKRIIDSLASCMNR